MKTMYSVTLQVLVDDLVRVRRTFWVSSFEERQTLEEQAKKEFGFERVGCELNHLMTAKECLAELKRDVAEAKERVYHAAP